MIGKLETLCKITTKHTFKLATNHKATLMEVIFAIREKISSKSTHFFYKKFISFCIALN